MRVSWGWNSILLHPWRSKEELRQFVSQCPGGFLIGESVDQEREFYSATIAKELARDSDAFIFGICSEGHGVTPQLLVEPTLRACFVGANDEVVAVDVKARRIAYIVKLSYLFRHMIWVKEGELIVALHETGACAFKDDGTVLWNVSIDVLVAARLEGAEMFFEFMDSELVTVDVMTGKGNSG
jgi:hypothetical protein